MNCSNLGRNRILIVDDEAMIRRLLRQKLSREGYECLEAGSAEEALGELTVKEFGLVILDIMMPGQSGIELLPEIRASYPDTAVIMATAITEMDIAVHCMKHGADDYIPKPFSLYEVMLSVERGLEKKRLEIEIKEYQKHLEQKVEEKTRESRKTFLGAIEALVFALESKDGYTAGHSRRVSQLAVAIGREMDLSPDDIENLGWAGLLHDIGKIAVDQSIQNKPGKLSVEEYEHIMIHSSVGADIVRPVVNGKVVEIIYHHHDRYDGNGINQVVAGEDIPFEARILVVADAFDAMTSDRPYRPAMLLDQALDEIRRGIGTQFDPVVAGALLRLPVDG